MAGVEAGCHFVNSAAGSPQLCRYENCQILHHCVSISRQKCVICVTFFLWKCDPRVVHRVCYREAVESTQLWVTLTAWGCTAPTAFEEEWKLDFVSCVGKNVSGRGRRNCLVLRKTDPHFCLVGVIDLCWQTAYCYRGPDRVHDYLSRSPVTVRVAA